MSVITVGKSGLILPFKVQGLSDRSKNWPHATYSRYLKYKHRKIENKG